MKKAEISVGGLYTAKVSNKLTTVRVDRIEQGRDYKDHVIHYYHVTNLATGRKTVFRSAAKFRSKVETTPRISVDVKRDKAIAEDKTARPDLYREARELGLCD